MFLIYAMGIPPTTGKENIPQSSPLGLFFPFLLMLGIFYFLIIVPQNKKRKEHQTMMNNLKKGDKILTIGGIYGVIIGIKENIVVLKISEETKIEIDKTAISRKISENENI